jgi:hypothetical protein
LIMKKSNRAYLGLQTDKKKDKPFWHIRRKEDMCGRHNNRKDSNNVAFHLWLVYKATGDTSQNNS